MANVFYSNGIYGIIHNTINWISDTIKVVLIDISNYTLDQIYDQYLSTIPSNAKIAISSALTGKSLTSNIANADKIILPSVTGSIGAIVLFKDTGNPATSPLILYIDTSIGLPTIRNNQDFTITWDKGANKIFSYDPQTVALLHFDGIISGVYTYPLDESGNVWFNGALAGNISLSSVWKAFGPTSGHFIGGSAGISISDDSNWSFATNPFTIDFWFKTTQSPTQIFLVYKGTNIGTNVNFWFRINNGKLDFIPDYNANRLLHLLTSINTINDGNPHHGAIVRNGDTFTLYVDGISQQSVTLAGFNMYQTSDTLTIGSLAAGGVYVGYLDEFRISKGIARWTSNFTPPTSAYSPHIIGIPNNFLPFSFPFLNFSCSHPIPITAIIVTSVSPGSGALAGGYPANIYGSNFNNLNSLTTVKFGGIPATNVSLINSGQISCTVPPGLIPNSYVDVTVQCGFNSKTLYNGFTYTP
jgi:hypothetical protein